MEQKEFSTTAVVFFILAFISGAVVAYNIGFGLMSGFEKRHLSKIITFSSSALILLWMGTVVDYLKKISDKLSK